MLFCQVTCQLDHISSDTQDEIAAPIFLKKLFYAYICFNGNKVLKLNQKMMPFSSLIITKIIPDNFDSGPTKILIFKF